MKIITFIAMILLLAACASAESCSNEPYYRHASNETELDMTKVASKGPFSKMQVGAGCNNNSLILRRTIPLDD